ncbi:MAG: adenylosuccinate lyase [Candidatus Hydrothermarchaeaceae archaeon]|jgi:adenylosuccinate lyase
MAIHPIDFRYGSAEMKSIFEEESRLQKFLDVEAALSRAHATVGNIPKKDAASITKKASVRFVKLERVKEIEKKTKHDIMAVVKSLSEVCGNAGKYVHLGATSYDIVDTANALQFKEALAIVEKDLHELEKILLRLAKKHIKTVAVGRTHGQHAIPITYGLRFSIWAMEIRRHIERINEAKKRVLVGKMSGAVGTQASFGKKGIHIQKLVMKDLGLVPAEVSNQIVQRDRYAELISLLALIAATLDKIGREIRNLSRTEIAEVSEKFEERRQVGSSTMPHKRNPINAENICGLARVIKSNVFVALENVSLEHERDLTNSSPERVIIPESFILLDEILKRTKNVMKNLVLYPENIARNLEMTGGMETAEAVMMGLTEKGMGRQEAHELLRKLSIRAVKTKKPLKDVLIKSTAVRKYLSESEIDKFLDPENYIGTAVQQVKNVLARR